MTARRLHNYRNVIDYHASQAEKRRGVGARECPFARSGAGGMTTACRADLCRDATSHMSFTKRIFTRVAYSQDILITTRICDRTLLFVRKFRKDIDASVVALSLVHRCRPNPLANVSSQETLITASDTYGTNRYSAGEGYRCRLRIRQRLCTMPQRVLTAMATQLDWIHGMTCIQISTTLLRFQ